MKKIVSTLLAGVMTAGLLTGCGGTSSGSTGSADAAKASGEPVTLDVVWFSDGGEGDSFMALAEEYMQQNPNIKIELIEVPYADVDSKIKNMLNAGEAPALARLSNIGTFQSQLLNLDEYVSDPQAFHDNFRDDLQFIFDGKMIAAPMDVTANGLIYNKTAFVQAGVEVPQSEDEIWTWEEWKQAMETVVEKSDCTYGLVYDKSPQRFTTLLYQAGGRMLNEDMTASEYNSPEVQRAVSFFKELHDDGLIPTSVWLGAENPNNLFRTGQVAMHFAGSWMVSNYKDEITDFEWGVTYMPKDKTRSSIAGGKYIAAFQNSGVEKEAAAFIEWLSQPEQNARYCQENNYLSPVKGNESLEYEYGKEYFELFAKELEATETPASQEWGYQAFTTLVQNDLRDGLVEVLVGNKTVEDYTAEMETLMNDALQELKA